MNFREELKNKKRIVIKVGSSSLVHQSTGELDLVKVERLIRVLSDLKNQGKDVVLVSSGAVTVGCKTLGLNKRPEILSMIQACAAIGQGELMMLYQKLFMEYNHKAAQVLLTFDVITSDERRMNAQNTLKQLLDLDIIPIVKHHHERYDGNGYPGKLKGEEIPCYHSEITDLYLVGLRDKEGKIDLYRYDAKEDKFYPYNQLQLGGIYIALLDGETPNGYKKGKVKIKLREKKKITNMIQSISKKY